MINHSMFNQSRFEQTINVWITDPDSLVYEIGVEDVYKDFYKDRVCLILVITHEIQSFLIMIRSYWQNEK